MPGIGPGSEKYEGLLSKGSGLSGKKLLKNMTLPFFVASIHVP